MPNVIHVPIRDNEISSLLAQSYRTFFGVVGIHWFLFVPRIRLLITLSESVPPSPGSADVPVRNGDEVDDILKP